MTPSRTKKTNWFAAKLAATSQSTRAQLVFVWAALGILPFAAFYAVNSIHGTLFVSGTGKGLLEDYVTLSYFVYVPACASIATVLFPRFPKDILGILRAHVQEVSSEGPLGEAPSNLSRSFPKRVLTSAAIDEILYKSILRFQRAGKLRWVQILFYVIALAFCAYMTGRHWFSSETYGYDTWFGQVQFAGFLTLEIYDYVVFGFIFPFFAFKYFAILYTMRAVCKELDEKNSLRIHRLSHDNAGGMGEFGTYSFKLMTFLLPPIAPLFLYKFFDTNTDVLTIGFIIYIAAVVFAFLYPLTGAHGAMKKFKKQQMEDLSRQFEEAYDGFRADMTSSQHERLAARVELLDGLDQLHARAERMPVWPFNTTTLFHVVSVILGLVATLGIEMTKSLWIEWFKNLFSVP